MVENYDYYDTITIHEFVSGCQIEYTSSELKEFMKEILKNQGSLFKYLKPSWWCHKRGAPNNTIIPMLVLVVYSRER